MPRDGDAPLARFAHAIVQELGFSLGPPQRSDDGSTVIVPVRRTEDGGRRYALAVESAEAVSAVDTGRLDRLRIRNDSGERLLLPAGSLFEGRRTASRGTTAGVLLGPSATQDVEVKCVEPSRPIVAGDILSLAPRLASADTTQALLSRDQGLVWATAGSVGPEIAHDGGVSADGPECGRIVLDARGVAFAEIYVHPDAWRLAAHAGPDAPIPNALGLDATNAVAVAREFLDRLSAAPCHPSGPDSWVAADLSAAIMVIDGEVVHLLAFGRDLTRSSSSGLSEATPAGSAVEGNDAAAPAFATASGGVADADVAVVSRMTADPTEFSSRLISSAPPRRRKVLTTGWDSTTFASLERYSHKEFEGDRSAAIRSLVLRGLSEQGYMGPRGPPPMTGPVAAEPEEPSERSEAARASLEARIREYERIADTEAYAEWLRKRARLELVRLSSRGAPPPADTSPAPDSQSAPEPMEAIPEPEEIAAVASPAGPPPPPVDIRPLLRRAFAASASGRYSDALALFDDALTAEPDNRTALLGRAVALRRSGKAHEALDALDAVLRAEPTNAAALLNRGRLLQERGDFAGALEAFDRLAAAAPNDWDVWLVRGDVLAKLGRVPEALRAYAEAQRRNPDDEGLRLRIRSLENAESASAPPPTPRIPLPRDVQEGQSYIVRESKPNLSLRVLRALVARGVPSLVISSRTPEAVRRDVGLAGVHVLELSHTPGEGRHDPTALATLSHVVARVVQEGRGHGVIALDGVASLVLENGSRETLLFIERVHETILQSHAVFLVSLAPGELSDRDLALLERSLRTLS